MTSKSGHDRYYGFPIDTFENDKFTVIPMSLSVIPDLIGDPGFSVTPRGTLSLVTPKASFCLRGLILPLSRV
jgi:hypothetical protein